MQTEVITQNEHTIVLAESHTILITDVSSALDLAFSIQHETNSSRIALNKEAIT